MDSLPITPEQVDSVLSRCGKNGDWATGFFAALHTGPGVLGPADWASLFTPEEGFVDNREATTSLVTLLYLYNRVGAVMTDNPAVLCPSPQDTVAVEEWCSGYIDGARLHAAWRHDPVAMQAATVIAILAGEVPREELLDADEKPLQDVEEWLDRHRIELREHVKNLWIHFAPARKKTALEARAKKQTGRNDPCPCGSGKKYKKCCLEAVAGRR